MENRTTIYKQIQQFIMAIKNKIVKQKENKLITISEPSNGFPTNEKDWADFAKKNKVKLPFFCIHGIDFTRRTSDGKPYLSDESFKADGGELHKIQGFKIKK